MERADRASRDAILRKLFPGLEAGRDPEIGRYFRLRSEGRTAEALALFNRVLKVRYPDDEKRSALFNLFRRSDPRFAAFHDGLLWELHDSASARLRETLDRVCSPVSGIAPKDTYRLLSALEEMVRLLPEGREAARARLDELCALAEILGHRTREIERVRALAASYFDQGSGVRNAAAPQGRKTRAAPAGRKGGRGGDGDLDLSRVELSAEDVERVEIPAGVERREDRVLAYCFKYWKSAEDPAFERLVLLYSRKRGTPHHEILRAIRDGRAAGVPDEEILGRVSAALSPGYSYTTQGDLYMRRAWKALKERLEPGPVVPRGGGAAAPADRPRPGRGAGKAAASGTSAAGGSSGRARGIRSTGARQAAEGTRKPPRKRAAPVGDPSRPAETDRPTAPRGSVSDRIKALSGRRYDVYREEFLARVGPAIRDRLSERRVKPKDVFEDPLGRAEDLVRDFLERNYANPYMDWEGSDTRARVEDLGFSVPDLDGIIALWYSRRGN